MERPLKKSLDRKVHKFFAKHQRLDKIISIVKQQYFTDSDSIDNVEKSITSCNQSSEEEDYNIVHEENQNNAEHIDSGLNLSGSEVADSLNAEISSVSSYDNSSIILSQAEEAQEDTDTNSFIESLLDYEELFANENERAQYVANATEEWAREPGKLSKRKLDDLLIKLHPAFPNLPLSYKTLLHTPGINLVPVNGGQLWYKGIAFNLNCMNLQEYLARFHEIIIDVNIDGLPLHKSTSVRFWPILGRLVKTKNEPFIIALFKGKIDPTVQDFLEPFVREVDNLLQNGYTHNNIAYQFSIRHYILDAPARAKVKCCIEHGGYCACEKCEVVGEWIDNRMTYVELNEILRTDESFRNQEQPYHHQGHSPLLKIEAHLISQFRLDGLHLIDLGVFKRLMLALLKWNGPWKLHHNTIAAISHELEMIKDSCPSDFNRPPRSFKDFSYMKGTEFRRLLLYDGVLVFRDHFDKNIYKLFLLLHSGIFILRSPVLVVQFCDYANQLLRTFIKHSAIIFGKKFVVYNVHSMCHLSKECEEYGPLDTFSAYPFENKLFSIKTSLQSGYKPLEQAAYRDLEKKNVDIIFEDHENEVYLAQRRFIANEIIDGLQFKRIMVNDITFKCNLKDSCFKTVSGEISVLYNIVQRHAGEVFFVGYSFIKMTNVYDYPLPSSELGIIQVSDLNEERRVFPLSQVVAKCWLIPDGDFFLCFPLLYTMPILK
ncbi:hypothetical protein ALC62_08079 [Cyphomyrmex costatus]|uniref:Transposase domain-containing protein n=1 Tax=Cyphomyrmex costatus TaxID=456900 RepID=A0A151IH39_9HYME|nr:hypothetical protein ALC62_08079 [Cyphomyrmex costatus]